MSGQPIACTVLLRAYKLDEKSITKSVVASCCNSAMFLGFDRGPHWARPASAAAPPDDVPSPSGFPLRFGAKAIAARLAMAFRG